MDPPSTPADRMFEADRHLDRLSTILRSLRAPHHERGTPPGRGTRSSKPPITRQQEAATTPSSRPSHQQQRDRCSSPASPRMKPRSSPQTEGGRAGQYGHDRRCRYYPSSPRRRSLSAERPPRRKSKTDDYNNFDALYTGQASHRCACDCSNSGPNTPHNEHDGSQDPIRKSSSTVNITPKTAVADPIPCGNAGLLNGVASPGHRQLPPTDSSSSLRSKISANLNAIFSKKFLERAVRTWWRGLSCGVCFAAGAWARDGHQVVGTAMALAAVLGELALHEYTGVVFGG